MSFHAVAFGPYNELLRRMTQIALDASSRVPPNPARPVIDSSYNEAADTVSHHDKTNHMRYLP